MAKHLDAAFAALLATLEDRARTNGDKSIIKGVVNHLTRADANEALIAEIAALRPKKARPVKAAKTKTPKAEKQARDTTTKAARKTVAKSPKGGGVEADHAEMAAQA